MLVLILLFVIGPFAFANQLDLLEKGRDRYISSFSKSLTSYCVNSYKVDANSVELMNCYFQVKFDCHYAEDNDLKQRACSVVSGLPKIEELVLMTHASIVQGSKRLILKQKKGAKEELDIKSFLTKVPLLKSGTSSLLEVSDQNLKKNGNDEKTISSVREGHLKLMEIKKRVLAFRKIELSCADTSECEILGYGDKGCGGHIGSFVVSHRDSNFSSIKKLVSEFNSLDDKLQSKIRGFASTCSINIISKPTCIRNICQ